MNSKWIAVLLVASLAVNFALVGYLLGSQSLKGPYKDPTRAFPRWAHSLPEDRREVMRPVVREHRRLMRPKLRALREQHEALRTAIGAEPFDRQMLADTLSAMRLEHDQVQQAAHASFAEFVTQLSPSERHLLVEDMNRPRGYRHDKRGRSHKAKD